MAGYIGRMAYNSGSSVTSALNTGDISVAVNNSVDFNTLNWCPTCAVCDNYMIMVDSYFMGKTTLPSVRPLCYKTTDLTDTSLLDGINKIAAVKFDGPFSGIMDAMNWIRTNGLFITNQNYPSIVTSGNTLHLDAGLPASYPLVGDNWYDLTGNNNNGILNNGVTYNSLLKGYLEFDTFDAPNQYVSFSGVTNIPVGNSDYTIGIWFNTNTNNDNGLVGWGNYGSNNEVNAFRLTTIGLVNYWWGNDLSVAVTITPGNWYYAVATFDGVTRSIYVNGSLVGSDTPTGHNVTTSNNLTIGRTWVGEYFDGLIGDVQIFDRALSGIEISQTYNAMVTRYNGTNTEICLTPFYCGTPTPTPTPTGTPTPTPLPTTCYTVQGIWPTDDPSHPEGGYITYLDEYGSSNTLSGLWDTDTYNIQASSIVASSGVTYFECIIPVYWENTAGNNIQTRLRILKNGGLVLDDSVTGSTTNTGVINTIAGDELDIELSVLTLPPVEGNSCSIEIFDCDLIRVWYDSGVAIVVVPYTVPGPNCVNIIASSPKVPF